MSKRLFLALAGAAALCAVISIGAAQTAPASRPPAGADTDDPAFKPKPPVRLTEDQEKEVLNAIKDRMPARYEQLVRLRDQNPQMYRGVIRDVWNWYIKWRSAPKEVQDAYITDALAQTQIAKLVRRIADTQQSADARRQASDELKEVVGRQFDAQQTIRQQKLTEIEQQMQRLREEMQQRVEQRQKFIDERFDRYLRSTTQPQTSRPAASGSPTRPVKPSSKPSSRHAP